MTPWLKPFAVASMVSVLPPVMKNAEGPNSVLPAERSLVDSVRMIVCPSSAALSNTIVSPEAAALTAPRNVAHWLPTQSLVVAATGSAVLVTVSVVAFTGMAIADNNRAKADSETIGLDDGRMQFPRIGCT
ncbi:hypothetical protein ELE36_05175 [Pseudolysobacter antarcticus]|uniref:Uncharacterized protein n=1 Tax=Pseudolysobacter antarcticus TaxID=2511995 RepID=A0A411HHD4_9GAMM|nr:hypothetical protein ELE36_05175 [Pseudolysobacter antarcticus]